MESSALLLLLLIAAGDALAGDPFKDLLACEHHAARKMAVDLMPLLFARRP